MLVKQPQRSSIYDATAKRDHEDSFSSRSERRKRLRGNVRWRVLFFRGQDAAEVVEAVTQNVSSTGFYCLSDAIFPSGEILLCALKVPCNNHLARVETLTLRCRARIMRTEYKMPDGSYGIACHIEDYCCTANGSDSPENYGGWTQKANGNGFAG